MSDAETFNTFMLFIHNLIFFKGTFYTFILACNNLLMDMCVYSNMSQSSLSTLYCVQL